VKTKDFEMSDKVSYRAYIYPNSARGSSDAQNPYLMNFISAFSKAVDVVNKDNPSNVGIVNLFRYLWVCDVAFFNWIEDLPDKKGGIFQTWLFFLLMHFKSLLRLKVVWTLHNKVSHSKRHFGAKTKLVKSLLRKSDLIITHSLEGMRFALEIEPSVDTKRVFLFPHPVFPRERIVSGDILYDILIWGRLAPYKEVDRFLDFLEKSGLRERYRIKIVGKCSSEEYFAKLARYRSHFVSIENRFVDEDELEKLVSCSKFVLFTYGEESVISSGALMDSLAYRGNIIGPDIGAFADAQREGLIKAYKRFDDIPQLIDGFDRDANEKTVARIDRFIEGHTWEKFARALVEKLDEIAKE
jgi:beta-1,4-mannosyltransferase